MSANPLALMRMLERVARAIDTAMAEGASPDTEVGLEAIARAAVGAMRDAPPHVIAAAYCAVPYTYDMHVDHMREAWQAGLDAILNEKD